MNESQKREKARVKGEQRGECMRQASFGFLRDYKKDFGGSLLQGKRKSARPLSTKQPIHLVLKSTGGRHFNPTNRKLEKLFRTQAQKYGLKIYDLALNWSHIHALISIPSRQAYLAFIRTLTAALVRLLSSTLGKSLKGLFDLRPFTRILSWGREFTSVRGYLELNQMEARGLLFRAKKSKSPPLFPGTGRTCVLSAP